MGIPAAKQGDEIQAMDIHNVIVPGTSPVPTALPKFDGTLSGDLSSNVRVQGKAAAMLGGKGSNAQPHTPIPPGVGYQKPPENRGTIIFGSATVRINGKPAARHGDTCLTCNDPADAPIGTIVASGNVRIG